MPNYALIQASEKLHNEIAGIFQGNATLTINEVAEQLGQNYHTVRNHMYALIKEGKLENTGKFKDKAVLYSRPASKITPRIPIAKSQSIGMDDLFWRQSRVEPANKLGSLVAASMAVPEAVAWAYDMANRMRNGDSFNHQESSVIRTNLNAAMLRLETAQQQVQTLLNAEHLWGPDIKSLVEDPEATYQFTDDDIKRMRTAIESGIPVT